MLPVVGKASRKAHRRHSQQQRSPRRGHRNSLPKGLLYAAAVIEHALGRKRLEGLLQAAFQRNAANQPEIAQARYALLKDLPFRSIVTTNYDHFLNDLGWGDVINWQQARTADRCAVKLHGDAALAETMVLSPLHYAAGRHNPAVTALFETAAASASFLFLGYGLADDNVRHWLERICHLLKQGASPQHYSLIKPADWSPTKRSLCRELCGIECIDADLDANGHPDIAAFLHQLRQQFGCVRAPIPLKGHERSKPQRPNSLSSRL